MADTVFFDIESHSASQRFRMSPEEFFCVGGLAKGDRYGVSTDYATFRRGVESAETLVAHNGVSFDIPALGLDVLQLTADCRVVDTMIADSVVDPPEPGLVPSSAMRSKYSLQAAATRYGVAGKSGDLKAKAQAAGGFGSIRTDDPGHLEYLKSDVLASRALHREISERVARDPIARDYLWREHRVHALMASITTVGFDVDTDLLAERVSEAEDRKKQLIDWLVAEHDIPTTLPNGKPSKSPHATKAGKEALVAAFEKVGVSPGRLPRTPKGAPSFTADGLASVAEQYPEAAGLCEAVGALVGVRSVYGTADRYTHSDGRVHPEVSLFQASGRASFTKPGMTVFGARGDRVRERDIFVARDGYVLVSADLSQVDARAVAAHSGDREYAKLFDPGADSHEIVARMVWGDRVYDSNPKYYRKTAKVISHGTSYGMGVTKLALSANVSEDEARRVVETLNERFPRLQEWKQEVREEAETAEFLDNGFGRRMRPNHDRAFTQGPALYGQGTARDILMEGVAIRMPVEVQRMCKAVIHDEGLWEVPEDQVREVCYEIEQAMTFDWGPSDHGQVMHFEAECSKPGKRWSECYD